MLFLRVEHNKKWGEIGEFDNFRCKQLINRTKSLIDFKTELVYIYGEVYFSDLVLITWRLIEEI